MTRVAWLHCNQIFFALEQQNELDQYYDLIAPFGSQNNVKGSTEYSVRKLFLSIQFFGLLDVSTWPTRMLHVPDNYLNMLRGEGFKIVADNGQPLKRGSALTYYRNSTPALFKRSKNITSPLLQLDYENLYAALIADHKEITKQQFIDESDESKLSAAILKVNNVDRIPVIELMIKGLRLRERKQKRHAFFDSTGINVYFGFSDVNRLLVDTMAPNQKRVKDSRLFVDMLAGSSSIYSEDKDSQMSTRWGISNFSSGGLLITTEDADFREDVQIDMLIAFTTPENKQKPTVGLVRRLNRTDTKQVEIAVVKLSNHAESAAVQDQSELDSSAAKAVILIRNNRDEWNLVVKTSMPYLKGQPLKLIRANGSKLPIRLGKTLYIKKDFKVFEVSSPGLQTVQKS